MESGKVKAIATTIIAIALMGFAFDKTYNSEKNIRDRCMAKFESFINEFDSNKETDWMAWTVHVGIAKRSLKGCLGLDWKDPLGIDWEEPFQGITPKQPL